MSRLTIMQAVTLVEGPGFHDTVWGAEHTVSLVDGVPVALDGVAPAIAVHVTDPEQDAPRLLRAAEELLPIYRQAPGVVVLDDAGAVQGVVLRADLERSVLHMRRRDYPALARGLGLRGDYRPPAGEMDRPFVYWRCPQCQHVYVPLEGHEDDPPDLCQRHEPPVQMERHVHGGE